METESVTCYREGCGYSPFPMSTSFVRRAKRTGEAWWCPAGHRQFWKVGKSDNEKEIDRLRAVVLSRQESIDFYKGQAWKWEGACPWTGCDFQGSHRLGLRTHMRARHGMPSLAAVREDEEAVA